MKLSSIIALLFALILSACNGDGKMIRDTELHGYQNGHLRIKMDEKLQEIKLESGEPGYLLTTKINYSEGRKKRVSTLTRTWMKTDYSLVRKENKTFKADILTEEFHVHTKGKDVIVTDFKDGKAGKEETISWTENSIILSEPLPSMYLQDLPKVGDQKAYWIFYDPMRGSAPVRVKNKEKVTVTYGDKSYECFRYSVRSMSNAGKYNDYYVDTKDGSIVKIVVANIEFVPPGTHR